MQCPAGLIERGSSLAYLHMFAMSHDMGQPVQMTRMDDRHAHEPEWAKTARRTPERKSGTFAHHVGPA
jgi:hypothetical protein